MRHWLLVPLILLISAYSWPGGYKKLLDAEDVDVSGTNLDNNLAACADGCTVQEVIDIVDEMAGGGGSGTVDDDITVNGASVDTTGNFEDSPDIQWTRTDGGVGGPDDITAGINWENITALDVESPLEGVMDLQDLQGAVTDAQVPDNITITNLSGTNTGDVSLSGTPDYITILNQVLTLGLIDLATDITGLLPLANIATVTGSRALVSTAGGVISASSVTAEELGYLAGVESAIQTQLDAKQNTADDVTLADSKRIILDPAPASDHSATGIITTRTAGTTCAFGDVMFPASDGDYDLADADASTTMPGVTMCVAAITATNSGEMLLQGYARDDTWAWTVGGLIYVSTTGTTVSTLTQTGPSGTGDQVQVVGYAVTADIMYFNPSLVLVEVA